MKTSLLSLLLVFVGFSLSAQISAIDAKPYIQINGHAENEVTPDEIYISVYILERYEGKTKITIYEQQTSLLKLLKEKGLDTDAITMSGGNASYIRIPWKTKKDVLASANYEVVVATAEDAAKVFEATDELNLSNCRISHVDHSKRDELEKEVRINAMKNAAEKADYMLEAVGSRRGGTLFVSEGNQPYPVRYNENLRGARSDASYMLVDGVKMKDPEFEVSFQKIELSFYVSVRFEITE